MVLHRDDTLDPAYILYTKTSTAVKSRFQWPRATCAYLEKYSKLRIRTKSAVRVYKRLQKITIQCGRDIKRQTRQEFMHFSITNCRNIISFANNNNNNNNNNNITII